MQVNSIDEYGIIARLRASKTKESKEALILIKGLQSALKRQQQLTSDAIKKLLECTIEVHEWVNFNDNPEDIGIYLVKVSTNTGKIISGRSYWDGEAWDIFNLMHNAGEKDNNNWFVIQWRRNQILK